MWDKILLVLAAGVIVIGGVMFIREPDPVVPKGGLILEEPFELIETIEFGWDVEPPQKVSFWNEEREIIVIDLKTGNVTIAEGLELDEASREFWKTVRLHWIPCPSL